MLISIAVCAGPIVSGVTAAMAQQWEVGTVPLTNAIGTMF